MTTSQAANDDYIQTEPAAPAQPTKTPREPMDSEDRAWLIGVIVVVMVVGLVLGTVVRTAYHSDDGRAREKTKQIQACTDIEDSLGAYACVIELSDRD